MAKSAIITLTTAGTDTGPFNLLSDVDSYATPFETNVAKSSLIAGYTTNLIPDAATIIRVQSSSSLCTNFINLTYPTISTTTTTTTTTAPTTSTTTTTTTAAPTTSTTTTTTTTAPTTSTTTTTTTEAPTTSTTTTTSTTSTTTTSTPVTRNVTGVGGSASDILGEIYINASVSLDGNVSVETVFDVNVTTVPYGTVSVSVTILSGSSSGSGSTFVGMGSLPSSISGECITACDNVNVVLTGFTC
jgi:hypothetical protein